MSKTCAAFLSGNDPLTNDDRVTMSNVYAESTD